MRSAAGKNLAADRAVTVGVLGIQGSIVEHMEMLRKCGVEAVEVLRPEDLEKVDGLILPGGESTTLSKLMEKNGLLEPLRARIHQGLPVYGTCAGMILLGKNSDREMRPLGVMDIEVDRNAYGRQVDSFEAEVELGEGETALRAVFIRAPKIRRVGEGVEVLAEYEGTPILCRQKNLLAGSFHPELTEDTRVHEAFIQICKTWKNS